MNTLTSLLATAWQNKHTSTAALVLFGATAVGIIWPEYKGKADEIARAAMMYGLITAGDARATTPDLPVEPQPLKT